MPLALLNSVDMELLIESSRDELFKKITYQDPSYGRRSSTDNDNKPITFYIQNSFLSDDGSERIFKVKCDTFEHSYYAFEFKGYVVCPAFLVSMFNLTDYACLDVRNGSHFYYIFLNRIKDDDPLPIILDKQSNFLGEFKVKVPSEAHRLLSLNLSNKDLKYFIVSPSDEKLCDECLRFGSNTTAALMKSEAAPSYWFVTLKLKTLFKAKHSLFTFKYSVNNIFVHEDSKSFAEFQKISKPITEGFEDDSFLLYLLSSIFTATEYKREDYILNAFTYHIRRNFEVSSKSKVKVYFCSMIAVLQSSGYGKSRLMYKLGGRTPTFYSSLQPGAGYPRKSFFLARLIEELNRIILDGISTNFYCHMNNVSTAVYIYILRMLFIILKKPGNEFFKEYLSN